MTKFAIKIFFTFLTEPLKTTSLTLPIDIVALLDPDQPVTELGEMLCSSITDQLVASEKCLCQFPEVCNRSPDKSIVKPV